MTAAMKTNPLLLVALEAVMWAPSGDQLMQCLNQVKVEWTDDKPKTTEECTAWRILEWFGDLSHQFPIGSPPDFNSFVV